MRRAFLVVLLIAVSASSTPAADWSTTSLSWLHGSDYSLSTAKEASVLTFDHASGWRYGDNFFFFDVFRPFGDRTRIYGEWHSRLSLGKLTGDDWGFGPVKDVLLAGELNNGMDWRGYLYGVGFDLKVPAFQFFKLHLFLRDDRTRPDDSTWQITTSWNLPFTLGETRWEFRGAVDYAGPEGNGVENILAQPQLLWDVGALNGRPGRLLVGMEYRWFWNQFGNDGVTESVPQMMVKWVF